jgi:acetyl-CoA acetyltransferase
MKAEDSLWAGLTDTYAKLPMGLTAEKLGAQYSITREQCDEFGLRCVDGAIYIVLSYAAM